MIEPNDTQIYLGSCATVRPILCDVFGKLPNDYKADDLARKLGLMVDEYVVVYGFNGKSFL